MLKLSDIFTHLANGEYSQHYLGGDGSGIIAEENYKKIIPHINLGLTEIYKRIPVKVKEVTIEQYVHISRYTLHTDFAETNTASTQPTKYISDSAYYPFINDVLKITRVFSELGEELFLNDYNQNYSLFTPEYNVIQHPYPETGVAMEATYNAAHPTIDITTTQAQAEALNLELPVTLLEPLLYYIGSRPHIGLGADQPTNQNYMNANKYEQSMNKIELLQLFSNPQGSNLKLEDKGFI